jgi:uncharacterized protein (TIGR03086 family)
MSDLIDLTPSTQAMTDLVSGTRDDQLDAPTPIGMTVAQVLGHVHDLAGAFRDAATKGESLAASSPPDPAASALPDDWREVIPLRLAELASAWQDPAAWEGMTRAGGLDMPGDVAGAVALDELVLHAWDLAKGTGQAFEPDPAALDAAEGFCVQIPDEPEARQGLFGPRVAVPQGSSQLDQVLGLAGRDPAWRV